MFGDNVTLTLEFTGYLILLERVWFWMSGEYLRAHYLLIWSSLLASTINPAKVS